MAFQTGTPVDPRLIQRDSSQYIAGAARDMTRIEQSAQKLQNDILGGVKAFEQKQQEKKDTEMSLQLLKEHGFEGYSDEALKAGIKSAGGPTQLLKTITDMEARRAMMTAHILEAKVKGEEAKKKLEAARTEPELRQVKDREGNVVYNQLYNPADGKVYLTSKGAQAKGTAPEAMLEPQTGVWFSRNSQGGWSEMRKEDAPSVLDYMMLKNVEGNENLTFEQFVQMSRGGGQTPIVTPPAKPEPPKKPVGVIDWAEEFEF